MMVQGQQVVQVKHIGQVITDRPQSNIQKLMYYLSCVNSCVRMNGQQLFETRHTNYKEAFRLNSDEETLIVLLASILSPDELIDVCFFVVPEGSACLGGSSNEFLEITQANQVVGAAMVKNKIALFKGEKVQTNKVMVFTATWLKNYFLDPISGEIYRLKALQQKKTGNPCPNAQKCEHFERLQQPHCASFTHPCPYQQSCWSLTDPEHLKFYTHANHLPKCRYAGACKTQKDPTHRAQFHHPGMRDYMIKCKHGSSCRERGDNVHVHKYWH